MTAEIMLRRASEEDALRDKRDEVAAVRNALAEREGELAQLRGQLRAFETRYFHMVGVLYAELDDLEARIAEREVALYDSDASRERAASARQRAQETREAAAESAVAEEVVEPTPSLKALFREVAKRIHPDFARDDAEQVYLTLMMARANAAYRRGDAQALERLLADQVELRADRPNESLSAEMLRLLRQIQHARRDLAALENEREMLLASEIAQLYVDAEAATKEHRDLLLELASSVSEQVEEAKRRFEFVDRQIAAHGR